MPAIPRELLNGTGWFNAVLLVFWGESGPGAVSVCRDYLNSPVDQNNSKWWRVVLPNRTSPCHTPGRRFCDVSCYWEWRRVGVGVFYLSWVWCLFAWLSESKLNLYASLSRGDLAASLSTSGVKFCYHFTKRDLITLQNIYRDMSV